MNGLEYKTRNKQSQIRQQCMNYLQKYLKIGYDI